MNVMSVCISSYGWCLRRREGRDLRLDLKPEKKAVRHRSSMVNWIVEDIWPALGSVTLESGKFLMVSIDVIVKTLREAWR